MIYFDCREQQKRTHKTFGCDIKSHKWLLFTPTDAIHALELYIGIAVSMSGA